MTNLNRTQLQESSWGPGFRVGMGYQWDVPAADLHSSWTRFHHQMSGHARSADVFSTVPVKGLGNVLVGGDGYGGGQALSRWDLHLDMIDFNFGYLMQKKYGSLHPYAGVLGGYLRQKQVMIYDNFSSLNVDNSSDGITVIPGVNAKVSQESNFQGVGLQFGTDGEFLCGKGISLLGSLNGALVYGRLSSFNHTMFSGNQAAHYPPSVKLWQNQMGILPKIQAQLGFNVDLKSYFSLSVLYEMQYWIGAWNIENSYIQAAYVTQQGTGNLSLQGITIQASSSF